MLDYLAYGLIFLASWFWLKSAETFPRYLERDFEIAALVCLLIASAILGMSMLLGTFVLVLLHFLNKWFEDRERQKVDPKEWWN